MKVLRSLSNVLLFNRRNWKAVTLSVFAATAFWFLNALNKTYTTNLRFPLTFEYDEENFVPVNALPKDIRLNVTGNGWDLFRKSTGVKVNALEIPVDRPADTRKIPGNSLPLYFSHQLDGLKINYVLTDTIHLALEPKAGRFVKLTLDPKKLNIRQGFGLASFVSIMPDSIFVEGPEPIIKSFEEPVEIALGQQNIDEHFMEDVEVELPSAELLKRNPPTVVVMFNVESLVAVNDSVQLVIENLPEDVWPVMGRDKIPFSASIPLNMMEGFHADSLKAIIDLKGLSPGEHKLVPVVSGLPPFSKLTRIDSVHVQF